MQGVFLLFAAAVLLLITTISAPVVNNIGLLKVTLSSGGHVYFGSFGYCQLGAGTTNGCSGDMVGYKVADIISQIDSGTERFSTAAADSANGLTNAMILHPIACGMAFVAFFFALCGGPIPSILSSVLAAVTWIVTLVVMAIDFALFGVSPLPLILQFPSLTHPPPDRKRPRQRQRLLLPRHLLHRNVDSPRSNGRPLLRQHRRPLHMLQHTSQKPQVTRRAHFQRSPCRRTQETLVVALKRGKILNKQNENITMISSIHDMDRSRFTPPDAYFVFAISRTPLCYTPFDGVYYSY